MCLSQLDVHAIFLLTLLLLLFCCCWLSVGHVVLRATSPCIPIRFISTLSYSLYVLDHWNFWLMKTISGSRPAAPCNICLSTPDASISLKTFEQIAPLSAAKETSRVVWRSISSRHGRCILRFASVHANALRSAQPKGNPGTDGASSPNSLFSPLLCLFIQSFFLVIFR